MRIITNNQPRPLFYGTDLPESVRDDYDYLDDTENTEFFIYKGQYYCLDDFLVTSNSELKDWHGVSPQSYFHSILIRFCDSSHESLIVATALS